MVEMNYIQTNYYNWENGKRKKAIGISLSIPSKHKKILKEIRINFINADMFDIDTKGK